MNKAIVGNLNEIADYITNRIRKNLQNDYIENHKCIIMNNKECFIVNWCQCKTTMCHAYGPDESCWLYKNFKKIIEQNEKRKQNGKL